MPPANSFSKSRLRFRVIKVGGSLFTMPNLRERIGQWSEAIADRDCVDVWIAGGGAVVDAVRDWQSLHGLHETDAHEISIGLLSKTAQLFHRMFPDWGGTNDAKRLTASNFDKGRNVVFDCCNWALKNESLSPSWETTSDTIALQLAITIKAEGVYLLKSISPVSTKINEAIAQGVLDQNFALSLQDSPKMSVGMTNLRESLEVIEMSL